MENNNEIGYHKIVYPWGGNFVEWLQEKTKEHNIPFSNMDTDGDYYQIYIGDSNHTHHDNNHDNDYSDDNGDNQCEECITFDWKHLSINKINFISSELSSYGYKIICNDMKQYFDVSFIEVNK